jgi:hypothetical protein
MQTAIKYDSAISGTGRTPGRRGGTCVVETWKSGDLADSPVLSPEGTPVVGLSSTLGDNFLVLLQDGRSLPVHADHDVCRIILSALVAHQLWCGLTVNVRRTGTHGRGVGVDEWIAVDIEGVQHPLWVPAMFLTAEELTLIDEATRTAARKAAGPSGVNTISRLRKLLQRLTTR